MGRKKTYDRDVLIDRAVDLFRDHGFASTSTQMLVEDLGVNRYSLYAEFGSKQGLFDAALQRYDETLVDRRFRPLEEPDAGLAEVRALFGFYGQAGDGPAAGRGCLLCNTAVELGPVDPSGAGFVQRYVKRIRRSFRAALGAAAARGELRAGVDVDAEADFLTSTVLGLFVLLRAKAPPAVLERSAAVALAHVDRLRA